MRIFDRATLSSSDARAWDFPLSCSNSIQHRYSAFPPSGRFARSTWPTPHRSSFTKHCDRSARPLVPSWASVAQSPRQRLKSLPIPDRTPPSFFVGTGVFLGVFEGRPEGVTFEGTPELRRWAGFEFRSPLARR